MIRWRKGVVARVRREWPGAVELDVTTEEGGARALAYPALVGRPEPGDTVLLNTTALAMGLGTGGYAMVVALPDRLPQDPSGPGHLVKARYTPLQATVLGVDEQDSPFHEVLRDADSLDGMPVIVADLHSALPAILCGLYGPHPPLPSPSGDAREADGEPSPGEAGGGGAHGAGAGGTVRPPRVVYVMLDGGALPAWFSMSCARLREAGWLAGTVTVGQAFGGDMEAVTLHTGLLAARHVMGADVAVVTQGPGNLGTGTRWGFSGVSAGEAVNAAAVLAGRPVAALRVSEGDRRERHIGVSHHSLTAYGRVALARAQVAVPELPGGFGERVARQAEPLSARHELVRVPVDGLREALAGCPVRLSTMGRGLDEDLPYFLASAAAGRHAASLLTGEGTGSGAL
ncbi:DUF3866 family protein [Streptosporangium sp. NPDC004379]|uniref:DUF3866 family protein n=1 Tax=Streptosporangium sp. NPDC004379 TaxID=3366189 RepID=UPI003677897A